MQLGEASLLIAVGHMQFVTLGFAQLCGIPGGIRTHDPLLRRQSLFPLSYRDKKLIPPMSGLYLMKRPSPPPPFGYPGYAYIGQVG